MTAADELRLSFGPAASAYAAHRPGYAPGAVRWALERAPGSRVLDLGAGTGKLTSALVDLGCDVIAVEPDAGMLAELERGTTGATALAGSAEAIPVPDGSVDAVLAGHALHWFDMDAAGPEIVRVLAPGGVLAGLWNVVDDREPWVGAVRRAAGDEALGPRDVATSWRAATAGLHLRGTGRTLFGAAEQAEVAHADAVDAHDLVARIATHAGLLVLPPDEREARLATVRRTVADHARLVDTPLTTRMLTGVLRTRRT